MKSIKTNNNYPQNKFPRKARHNQNCFHIILGVLPFFPPKCFLVFSFSLFFWFPTLTGYLTESPSLTQSAPCGSEFSFRSQYFSGANEIYFQAQRLFVPQFDDDAHTFTKKIQLFHYFHSTAHKFCTSEAKQKSGEKTSSESVGDGKNFSN